MTVLKILSYNIHKGFSADNRRLVLKRIKESILPLEANIVFLQEVIGEHEHYASKFKDWPLQSQFEFLADNVWSHFSYGKNAVYPAGHHGNAILSAFPISSWSNSNISTNKFEKRGLLHATIEVPTVNRKFQRVHCFCVHLSLFQGGRRKQVQAIADAIIREIGKDEPFILAGDFNDWRQRASDDLADRIGVEEVFFTKHGSHARTFPATFPVLCLDRIYVKGLNIIEARTLKGNPWRRLSDHLALYAEIELHKPKGL